MRYDGLMMTLHKLSAGDGYTYYTEQVASGDQLRAEGRELGDYYQVTGMPPGQWIGSGVHLLEGYGGLSQGDEVTEDQMASLFGAGEHPMTGTEIAKAFSDAEHAGRRASTETLESLRLQHAEEAWQLYELRADGMTYSEIAEKLSQQGEPLTPRGVGKRIAAYTSAGVVMPKGIPAQERVSHEAFVASYTMTNGETLDARSAARRAHTAAMEESLRQYNLGGRSRTYRGRTEFQQRFHEEVQRHNRTEKNAPTKSDFDAIRARVGGELFRKQHGRDATDGQELAQWITSQDQNLKQSVAGFDMVFTPVKSVSLAWGLGDERLRKGIEAAHEAAIKDALDYLESNAVYTRQGHNGVRQVDVEGGLIATKFRHHDSRTGDPNLHDHVVVANKVKAADGSWLALDGRMLYRHNVAASEVYNSRVMEHIHQNLGLEFVAHDRRGEKVFELAGIDEKLISGFSSRRMEISETLSALEEKFIAEHGHVPTVKQRNALAQQATLATRPAKEGVKSLEDLNAEWRQRAGALAPGTPLGEDLAPHLQDAARRQAGATVTAAAEVAATPAKQHALEVLGRLQEQRSTWTQANIAAETARHFRVAGAGSMVDPALVQATIQGVMDLSVGMTPAEDSPVPKNLRRADGSSVYRVAGSELFTSQSIIEAEASIVAAATDSPVIPVLSGEAFEQAREAFEKKNGWSPATAQVQLARHFATSEQLLAVGIGPAGAGKTTSTALFVQAAQSAGAEVIGMAPTAAAAAVISHEMGIKADTLDSYLMRRTMQDERLAPGTVVLVDELGMTSTPKLKQLLDAAAQDGAVVRGLGDHRQLAAIGSGGALRLLDAEAEVVHLEDVHRFRHADGTVNQAEAEASLALREPPTRGEDTPFQWHLDQGRVAAGSEEKMLGEVFAAWSADAEAGVDALMMAGTSTQVAQLNDLAQAKMMRDGVLDPNRQFVTASGQSIHVGDVILTRQNHRGLRVNRGKDFVKNGDTWRVKEISEDGAVKVQHTGHNATITLPADYARKQVELGYARTVHRAQGATVDRAYALVDEATTRANAYVALTRGRHHNGLFVATTPTASRDDVLGQIAANYELNLPIHEQVTNLRNEHRDVARRVGIYDDLAEHARETLVANAAQEAIGASAAASLVASEGFGAFAHEVTTAMVDDQLEPVELIRRAWQMREIEDADDLGAVMHWRVGLVRQTDADKRSARPENTRPFAQLSDEHLEALFARAKADSMTVDEAIQAAKAKLEDPRWDQREFGLVPNEQLKARRIGLAAKMRDNDDPEWRWLMTEMDAEVARRRWSSPEQRLVEEVTRGDRPRSNTHVTLAHGLATEREIRKHLLPKTTADTSHDLTAVERGISGFTVDPRWAEHRLVPESLRRVMHAHHDQIGQLTVLRGKQLATEQPTWVQALGPVPANPRNAERWYRVAGEVDAYRTKYRVPSHEERPIPPADYRRSPDLTQRGSHAEYLAAQVVDVHKRGAVSTRPARSEADVRTAAVAADEQQAAVEQPTEAEAAIEQTKKTPDERFEERITVMEAQWDGVVHAHQQQQAAEQELQAAEHQVQQLRERLAQLDADQEAARREAVGQIRSDYAVVADAQDRAEHAGMFTRSAREREAQQAQNAFEQKWGRADAEVSDDPQWLQENSADYRAAAQARGNTDADLSAAEARAGAAQVTVATTGAATRDAYADYVATREASAETRVAADGLPPAVAQKRLDGARQADMRALRSGARPTQRIRESRQSVRQVQENLKNPRARRAKPASAVAAEERQLRHRGGRSL